MDPEQIGVWKTRDKDQEASPPRCAQSCGNRTQIDGGDTLHEGQRLHGRRIGVHLYGRPPNPQIAGESALGEVTHD
jgi:hypothetical protein